jgi:hypothetical protein
VTGESLGLLIEEARTNLITYSEQFDNASWTKVNASITTNTSATTAPDGTLTADKLVENAGAGDKQLFQGGISQTLGTPITQTFFAKAAERTFVFFGSGTTMSFTVSGYINLSTGSAVSNGPTIATVSTVSYPNGWYRCSITATPTVTTSGPLFDLRPSINGIDSGSYTGDGTSGIYLWGAQIEQASFPTSYIPTVASTRTRAADSASITGKNFSSFYNPDEGSVSVKFKFYANHGPYCEAVSIAGSGAGFMVNDIAGGLVTDCYGGNTVFIASTNSEADNARTKFITGVRAYKFSTNDSVIGCSGASSITIQTGTITNPNTTALWLGRRGNGSTSFGSMNGHLQQVSYYPKRLPDAQLQALTK